MKKRILSMALAVLFVVSMAVPAFAAETKDVKIKVDYDKDGKTDFTWTVPKVYKTEKMVMAELSRQINPNTSKEEQAINSKLYKGIAGKEVKVYTIKAGTKISLEGSYGFFSAILVKKDGKLEEDKSAVDWDKIRKYDTSHIKKVDFGDGYWYGLNQKGDYYSFIKEGYYLFEIYPFTSYRVYTDPESPNLGGDKYGNLLRKGYAVLHVVKNPE